MLENIQGKLGGCQKILTRIMKIIGKSFIKLILLKHLEDVSCLDHQLFNILKKHCYGSLMSAVKQIRNTVYMWCEVSYQFQFCEFEVQINFSSFTPLAQRCPFQKYMYVMRGFEVYQFFYFVTRFGKQFFFYSILIQCRSPLYGACC